MFLKYLFYCFYCSLSCSYINCILIVVKSGTSRLIYLPLGYLSPTVGANPGVPTLTLTQPNLIYN